MRKKAFLAVTRAVAIIGQVGVVKLYTHFLLPAQLGRYFFFLTISYFLNALVFVPIDYFQQAEVFRLRESGNALGGLLRLNAKLLAVIGLLGLVVSVAIAFIDRELFGVFCLTMIYSIVLYASTAAKNFLNNQDDQVFVVVMLIVEIPIRIITFLVIVNVGFVGPLSLLVATAAAPLMVGLAALPRMRSRLRLFKGSERCVSLSAVLRFGAPISCSALLNWLQLQGYRLVLLPLGYAEAVGYFATASAIGSTGMAGASTVYQQIYLPRIYQTAGAYLRTYLKGAVGVICIVLTVGIILRVPIVRLVTNGRFVGFAWLIGYGILIEAGNFVIGALVVQLSIDNNTVAQVKANIYGAVSVLILFLALRLADHLTVFTIGVPLVAAQLIVIAFLVFRSEINPWNKSIRRMEAPSLS
jgi:hypothetical protein